MSAAVYQCMESWGDPVTIDDEVEVLVGSCGHPNEPLQEVKWPYSAVGMLMEEEFEDVAAAAAEFLERTPPSSVATLSEEEL